MDKNVQRCTDDLRIAIVRSIFSNPPRQVTPGTSRDTRGIQCSLTAYIAKSDLLQAIPSPYIQKIGKV